MTRVRILDLDSERLEVLRRMRDEDLVQTIMYTWTGCSDEDWLKYLKGSVCLTVMVGDEMTGMAWFDRIQGRTAFSNYLLFREYQAQAVPMGKLVIDWMVEKMNMRMLLGVSPKPYRHSRNILEAWGYQETLTLPDACYMAKYQRHVDGILYVRKS